MRNPKKRMKNTAASIPMYTISAFMGLAACDQALGNPEAAVTVLSELRRQDPTEPHYVLLFAQAVYDSGRHREAKAMLLHWLKQNKGSPVLYRSFCITTASPPRERDPITTTLSLCHFSAAGI